MSKGGKIGNEGLDINVHQLDTLYFNNLNEKISAIKIDTEGEDLNVLLGAEKLINKDRPQIIIEVREENKFKISKFLRDYSYKLYDVIDLEKEINLANYKIASVINLYAKNEK